MNKKLTIFLITPLVVIYFIVCVLWAHFTKEVFWKGGQYLSASTIKESKRRGAFIEKLAFEPDKFVADGIEIKFEEVWIEKQHGLSFIIVLIPSLIEFPIFTNQDTYNINFTFEDNIIPDTFDDWWFVREGEGGGFGTHSTKIGHHSIGYLSDHIDNIGWDSIDVLLTNNWDFKDAKKFQIIKIAQQ